MGVDVDREAVDRFHRAMLAAEAWLSRRRILVLGLMSALVAALKSGIATVDVHVWTLDSWPDPLPVYPPLTYGHRLIAFSLQVESGFAFRVIAISTTVAAVVLMGALIGKAVPGNPGRLASIVLLGGPVTWVLSGGVGRTDAFVLLGGVLLATLGRHILWSVVAAVLMILGNPEQAAVASAGLLVLSLAPSFGPWRRGSAASLVASLTAFGLLTAWSNSAGVPSRTDYFGPLISQSLVNFFMQLPLTLYVGFGLSLIPIGWALLNQGRRTWIPVAFGCLLLPVLVSAVTLDQTRVVVCCAIACVTATLVRYSESLMSALSSGIRYPLALLALLVLLLPAVEVAGDTIRLPWGYFYPYIQAYLIG